MFAFYYALLFLTASMVTATHHPEDKLEDGIYRITKAEHGVEMERNSGGRVLVGKRVCDIPSDINLKSMNNENSRFSFTAKGCGPFEKSDPQVLAIVIDGICEVSGSFGSSKDKPLLRDYQFVFQAKDTAQLIGERLKIEPKLRKHPGHKMLINWKSVKPTWKAGDDVELELEIKNVGDVPFKFLDGGQNRGFRNNQFKFMAFRLGGKPIPDIGDPENSGGPASYQTVKPGETFKKKIGVSKWFEFAPDAYELVCMYELEIFIEEDFSFVSWEDFATGKCRVDIEGK